MEERKELLDDISQVSEISMKSLFNEKTPEWVQKRDDRIEPFYPKPITRENVSSQPVLNRGKFKSHAKVEYSPQTFSLISH